MDESNTFSHIPWYTPEIDKKWREEIQVEFDLQIMYILGFITKEQWLAALKKL